MTEARKIVTIKSLISNLIKGDLSMTNKIFLALMETQAAHWTQSRKEFQKLSLSDGQPKILYILREFNGCVQKDLADMCKIKPSTMTVLLDRLEKEGYIEKSPVFVSGGKRAKGIFLTDTGRAMADKVYFLMEELEHKSLAGFSEAEKQALFLMLERITGNLE